MSEEYNNTTVEEQVSPSGNSRIRRTKFVSGYAGGRASEVVYYIAGIINTLLVVRIILSLLGANPGNTFAKIVYNLSRPFVIPFFGLFRSQYSYGISRFEAETFVAIIVYSLLAWMVAKLVKIIWSGNQDGQ